MEVLNGNQSFNGSYYDYNDDESNGDNNNELEKTFVTVHVDSFNEHDFTNFLNCLDTFRESNKKRKNQEKVIKNYCVQVPYIDNSLRLANDDDDVDGELGNVNISNINTNEPDDDKFEKKCDEMKQNISQMFSYFDEDVQLNFDDEIDQVPKTITTTTAIKNKRKTPETYPVIRGVVRKRNVPPSCPSPNILKKNQVDKLMNEFNRVKINYYSKDNYVEFTNVDYFYCDSDIESMQNEKVGKLNHQIFNKFQKPGEDDSELKRKLADVEIVPKNSVRDKISMFSKLDLPLKNNSMMMLTKCNSEPLKLPSQEKAQIQRNAMIRNTACANKNQNKCFIKDINNSLIKDEKNLPDCHRELLTRIVREGKLVDNCSALLMSLEHIVNRFGMSLLFTLNGLLNDNVFSLGGHEMTQLALTTRPSLKKFNQTFDNRKIDECTMKNVELSVVDVNQIQLQMHISFINVQTKIERDMKLNVIFMAQYNLNQTPSPFVNDATEDSYFIYFTSLFEVKKSFVAKKNYFPHGCEGN